MRPVAVRGREDARTSAARVRDALRVRIASGDLAVGSRLREEELAGRYRVSRTPVREALRHLAAEGLVTILPHAGAQVAGVSLAELDELYEIRGALEVLAAARAVERMTAADVRGLRAQLERCDAAARGGDLRTLMRENARFHDLLYAPAASPQLLELIGSISERLQRYRAAALSVPERPVGSVIEHRAILAAAVRRDLKAVRDLVTKHSEAARSAATRWYLEQGRRRPPRAEGGAQ